MRRGRGEPFIGIRPERKKPVCQACGAVARRPHSSHRNRLLERPCLSCGSYCVPVFRQFTNYCATCGADRTAPPPPDHVRPILLGGGSR